jgi:hypothetical protein
MQKPFRCLLIRGESATHFGNDGASLAIRYGAVIARDLVEEDRRCFSGVAEILDQALADAAGPLSAPVKAVHVANGFTALVGGVSKIAKRPECACRRDQQSDEDVHELSPLADRLMRRSGKFVNRYG